jgi:hypothetical protein
MRRTLPLAAAVTALAVLSVGARGPRFFPDDPVWQDDDRALDASGAKGIPPSNMYDFAQNTFLTHGEEKDLRALNINTVDEVPDSTWFTNRIGRREMTPEEIVRGPDRFPSLSIEGWPIVQAKEAGKQPGYRVLDPKEKKLYQIEFDPVDHPEMATSVEIIGTVFYHAFGYHVVEDYLVEIDPATIVISPQATITNMSGKKVAITRADVDEILRVSARQPNGKYRAIASRFADGEPLENFRYHGTRSDDPNDVFPHEHRRELRANRVFAAWLNHDDSRGINSLDMLETASDGRKYVKHYMFDFGSILGSGTNVAQVPRAGNEYILDWKAGFLTLATLGLYGRPWIYVDYPDVPVSVGRLEADFFDAEKWKPEYPNPAFRNMRTDDAFWAARIVSKFGDDVIRKIVEKGAYSDPQATDYVTGVIIKRRDKVLRTWLNQVNPLVDFTLATDGELKFENAAVQAGVATPAASYRVTWSTFDNAADSHEPAAEQASVTELPLRAPAALLSGGSEYIAVRISSVHPQQPDWAQPVTVYFRRAANGWQTVGIERQAIKR